MTLRLPARTSPALAGLVLCAALALGGCATAPQMAALERAWPAAWPDQVLLGTVPFFAQDDHLCGPAALAMVAQAAGRSVTPQQLTPQVYLPGRQGALQVEMLAATRRQGFEHPRLGAARGAADHRQAERSGRRGRVKRTRIVTTCQARVTGYGGPKFEVF